MTTEHGSSFQTDTFPTAMHVASALQARRDVLLQACKKPMTPLAAKSEEFSGHHQDRPGPTRQDADTLTLGRILRATRIQVEKRIERVNACLPRHLRTGPRRTAVGTAAWNTKKKAGPEAVAAHMADITGLPFSHRPEQV